jgi:leucyl/phenylalanyl-tRNA--protein transferase
MFSRGPNGSKIALAALCMQLQEWGFAFLDCQQATPATEALGARIIRRREFLDRLRPAGRSPTRVGKWRFTHLDPEALAAWEPGGSPA